jgi:hypothetical protein
LERLEFGVVVRNAGVRDGGRNGLGSGKKIRGHA